MASEEIRKKWGTIFMGEREASVEQLSAMQEPLRREKQKKEQTEDYMERVRARAADRAREILGAAYTERQDVLQEAKNEIAALKRQAAEECARLKAEGEAARKLGQAELERARQEREKAEQIRLAAHDEGFESGMDKAGQELHEFRAELGQSIAAVLGAIERQRKHILETWREELVTLTQCVAQAGTGFILQKEHETILRNLVFQALDLLENRSIITVRVNPEDEAQVADMFRAARERAPELKQWIVTGDSNIERGGLVAESGSGSVDLQRQNFREMIGNILVHLGLPDSSSPEETSAMRELVEKEVAHIASLTPESDHQEEIVDIIQTPEQPDNEEPLTEAASPETVETVIEAEADNAPEPEQMEIAEPPAQEMREDAGGSQELADRETGESTPSDMFREQTSLEELEEELFPLDNELRQEDGSGPPDSNALEEGGFL